jgi:hypothetical protein
VVVDILVHLLDMVLVDMNHLIVDRHHLDMVLVLDILVDLDYLNMDPLVVDILVDLDYLNMDRSVVLVLMHMHLDLLHMDLLVHHLLVVTLQSVLRLVVLPFLLVLFDHLLLSFSHPKNHHLGFLTHHLRNHHLGKRMLGYGIIMATPMIMTNSTVSLLAALDSVIIDINIH